MTGTDEQTDAVIKAGALPILGKLLQHSRMNLVKEVRTEVPSKSAGEQDLPLLRRATEMRLILIKSS